MGKSFDKLLEIAQKIKNNELPESNTNTLVGGHLMDIIEKCSEAVDLINENKVETDGKIGQVEQVLTESNLISLKDYSDTDLTNGYLTKTGSVVSTQTNYTSSFIPVISGDTVIYEGTSGDTNATASVVFFDISKKFKSILLQGSTTNISSTLTIVEDGYIRASSRNQNHASPGCLKIAIKGDNVDIVKNFNRISTQIADIEGTINTTKYKDIDAVLVEDNTYYSTEGEKTAYSGRIAYHYNTIDLFIKEATKGGVASYLALFYDQEDNIVGNTSITTSAYQYTDFDLQEYVIQNYSTVNVAKVIVSVNKEYEYIIKEICNESISESIDKIEIKLNDKINGLAIVSESLAQSIEEIKENIKSKIVLTEIAYLNTWKGYIKASDGSVNIFAGFTANEYSIDSSGTYYIDGSTGTGSSNCLAAFYDIDGAFIESIFPSSSYSGKIFIDKRLENIPSNAVSIKIQTTSVIDGPTIKLVQETVEVDNGDFNAEDYYTKGEIDELIPDTGIIEKDRDITVMLCGASFAFSANGWFELGCQNSYLKGTNKAIAGTNIMDTAVKMKAGTLYNANMTDIDVLAIMHVHNKNIYDNLYIEASSSGETTVTTYDKDILTLGGIVMKSDGTYQAINSTYGASEYIQLPDNATKFEIRATLFTGNGSTCFYDDNNSFISSSQAYNINDYSEIQIPANAKKFRTCCGSSDFPNFAIRISVSSSVSVAKDYDIDTVEQYEAEAAFWETVSANTTGTSLTDGYYAACFDYVLKKYALQCYSQKDNSNSEFYNSQYGKPCRIVICNHWHDGREKINESIVKLHKKWNFTLCDFAGNIGFTKFTKHPAGGQWSLLFKEDSNGPTENLTYTKLDGTKITETFGWHQKRGQDSEIQQRMSIIFSVSLAQIV